MENKETPQSTRFFVLLTESSELNLIIFFPGTSGLLLNEMFFSVFRGCVLEISMAAKREFIDIF